MVRSTDDQGAQPVFVKQFYFRCENMTDINKSDYKGGRVCNGEYAYVGWSCFLLRINIYIYTI